MKKTSGSVFKKTTRLFIAIVVAASFVATSAQSDAQTQSAAKRKFGPGQNALPQGVRPQAPQAKRPKPIPNVIVSKHGKWIVQCDGKKPVKAGAKPRKRECGLIQAALHEKDKRIGLTFILARVKQGDKISTMMRILAPIGVYLPTGVALEIDGKAAGRVPFSRCTPRNCVAFAQVRKETMAKMKKGSKGKFLIYEAPGIGIPLKLDLSGFSAALKSLDKT